MNGEFKVSPPCEFNDPFEFSPGIPAGQPSQFLREQFPDAHDIGATTVAWREDIREQISLFNGVVCFSDLDPFGAESIRHWAVYGAKHSGIAIEMNPCPWEPWFASRFFFKVEYPPARRPLDADDFAAVRDRQWLRLIRRWGGSKSCEWRPENEWRLIRPLAADPKFPIRRVVEDDRILYLWPLWKADAPGDEAKELIKRVVVGCRATANLEASVRNVCRTLGLHDDQVIRARECPEGYGLLTG